MGKKPLRVLQVFGSLNMGGAESRMMDIYRRLDTSEIQFDFVTLIDGKQYFEDEISQMGGTIYSIKSPREVGVRRHIADLRKCMKEKEYSAVHAHTSYHCGLVMVAAWLEQIPVRIAHARTTGTKSRSRSSGLAAVIGKIFIRMFSTHRFAISKSAGEYVFGKADFTVLPNTIAVANYQAITDDEIADIKKEYGIDDESIVIGQIGRFDAMKNHRFTIEWFKDYLKTAPSAKLMLIGDGELKDEIEKQTKDSGLSEKVIFTGVCSCVNKLIHVFNVLFFPSVFEGLGGVVLEAQAAGVPVVESDSIPDECDLGIGMVKKCSLNDSLTVWSQSVTESLPLKNQDYQRINEAFASAGYSIEAVTARLINTYKGIER